MKQYPSATFFHDYREMLAKLGDKVDAVSISTPDHTHYPATLAAMEMGKHVYTQKPLTHKLSEARHLAELAEEKGLTTQMGIQNQSTAAYRLTRRLLQDGLMGKISKVYVWSHKNWGYDGEPYAETSPVPEQLDWNLWLGTAPVRSYVEKKFHPGQWRRFLDYGCGTIGDMGIHIFDTPVKALGLRDPKWVEAECRAPNGFGYPETNKMHYGFDATEYTTISPSHGGMGPGLHVGEITRIWFYRTEKNCRSRVPSLSGKLAGWCCRIARRRSSTLDRFSRTSRSRISKRWIITANGSGPSRARMRRRLVSIMRARSRRCSVSGWWRGSSRTSALSGMRRR